MTKVVPYDAKGVILRFEAWNRVKNREGAVYAPVPQKLYQQLPKHWNICYIFIDSESIDTKKAFKMLPNRLQIDHWNLVFLRVSLWGVDLV